MPAGATVHLIGGARLAADCARAIAALGGSAIQGDPDAAAHGLFTIGKHIA